MAWLPMGMPVRAGLELSLTTLSHSESLAPAVTCCDTRCLLPVGVASRESSWSGLRPSRAGILVSVPIFVFWVYPAVMLAFGLGNKGGEKLTLKAV